VESSSRYSSLVLDAKQGKYKVILLLNFTFCNLLTSKLDHKYFEQYFVNSYSVNSYCDISHAPFFQTIWVFCLKTQERNDVPNARITTYFCKGSSQYAIMPTKCDISEFLFGIQNAMKLLLV
jgi:hypothetical protein